MKCPKLISIHILCMFYAMHTSVHANREDTYGRSYMFTRPVFSYLPLHEAGWHDIIYKPAHTHGGCLNLTPVYQQNIHNAAIDRYFAPCDTNTISVAGDDTQQEVRCARDVRAEWLQLPSDYHTTFHIEPRQTQTNIICTYHQALAPYTSVPFFKDTYVSISAPITHVRNNLEIISCDMQSTSTAYPSTLAHAFANPAWRYAKIAPKTEGTALSELQLRWGLYFLQEQYNQLRFYFGLSLPTSKKQNPKYWFNAVPGYDGHFGVNGGITCQFLLNRNPENCAVSFFANLDDLLLVKNHQCRTFDLKNKPWSRFLLYNSNPATSCSATNVPGVNILTRTVAVDPYNMADFSAGWRMRTKNCEIEVGYNLWGHGQESLELCHDAKTKCPRSEWGIAGSLPGTTASNSTIAQRCPDTYDSDTEGNPVFIPIKDCDIDLCSAAAASSINHAAHAVVSFFGLGTRIDSLLSLGCFAEYPQRNSALSNWGIWGKLGVSF